MDKATDPIDQARAEGIALGLAMAAQKYQAMDVMDDEGYPAWDYFAAAYHAILALATIPPHVAAARVLLDMPGHTYSVNVALRHIAEGDTLAEIAKEGE